MCSVRTRPMVTGLLCVFLAGLASAQDLAAPPWRGQPGSTVQVWTFSTEQNPVVVPNSFGSASAEVVVGPYGTGWYQTLQGLGSRTGFWDLGSTGGQIEISIDNWSQGCYRKDVWVQATYFKDITQPPTILVEVPGHPESVVQFVGSQTSMVEHVSTGGDWLSVVSKWRIEPSPDSERVVILSDPMGSVVDEVVVDTLTLLTADINGDCSVDVIDLLYMVDTFGLIEGDAGFDARCDLNSDGSVDVVDLLTMVENWGLMCPESG